MVERMDISERKVLAHPALAALAGASIWVAVPASAQERLPAPAPVAPIVVPPGAPPIPAQVTVAPAATLDDDTAPARIPTELVEVHPGGLTADQAGVHAAATSWNAKASLESLRGASARVDEAWAGFLPRLSGVAKYTRLSNFTSPPFFSVPGDLVAGPAGPARQVMIPGDTLFLVPVTVSVPFFEVNNWLLQGTITVPISDYFLSIDQKYTAATRSEEAARWDVMSARATALSNGKIEYYTWLRNRGAVIVAVQSLNDQKTHLRDARNQFAVGNASKADVLRAETAVSAAELTVEQATNLSDITEKQLRVAMHVREGASLLPGEDLETAVAPFQGNLQGMTIEALSTRPEIKSADANAAAAHEQSVAARAGRWPVLSAFGDGIYGNPNPRVVPPEQKWFGTWDFGAQVTWSPNDILIANGSVEDFQSRAANIEANKGNTRDGIEVEVQQDWQGVREADFAVVSSTRQLASAEEAYRVQRELFNNGRGTSTTLTDAETDLTRARLTLLNARADARIARIRLDHALGRDVRPASTAVGATP
jgi:outer membrane protein TolC